MNMPTGLKYSYIALRDPEIKHPARTDLYELRVDDGWELTALHDWWELRLCGGVVHVPASDVAVVGIRSAS